MEGNEQWRSEAYYKVHKVSDGADAEGQTSNCKITQCVVSNEHNKRRRKLNEDGEEHDVMPATMTEYGPIVGPIHETLTRNIWRG